LAFGPTNGQWMVGGDYLYTRQGHLSSNSLAPTEKRKSVFGRLSYEFAPAFELFGQIAWSRYQGQSFYQQTPSTGVTIQVSPSTANGGLINAYLPTSFINSVNAYNTANPASRVTSVSIGTSNAGIPAAGSDNTREVGRYVIGADGEFSLGGVDLTWDGYYQHGVTKTNELLTNTWNNARMALAQDAVVAPAGNAAGIAAGTIVCRSTLTAPTNGCVPINRIGVGGASQAALSYIFNGGNQPLRRQTLKEDVVALNLSTNNLFSTWAGAVSVATGVEYRREAVNGAVDPQFNTGWLYGNYLVTAGSYSDTEAYIETVVPLAKGLDFNGAVRTTDYSTSGRVFTWKAGLTFQPIADIKLRGTISRDIRAPNLGELFAPGTARTNTVNVPLLNGTQRTDQFTEQTVGNQLLIPEVAKTYAAGVVLTPSFLPGFSASIDYYNINLAGAINTLTAQQTVSLCYEQANPTACANITTTGGVGVTTAGLVITGIRLVPINFVSQRAKGIDIEASYRADLGAGKLTFRALATHYISYKINNGIDAPFEAAGVNYTGDGYGNTPKWTYRISETYDVGGWSFNLTGRGLSGGVYNNSFIECQTGCPTSTVKNRTINNNRIAGAFYLDFQTNYSFKVGSAKAQTFLSIRDLFNRDPVLVGNGPTGNNTPAYPQTNRNLYDVFGRVFRLGVRVEY
jgi:iron complex outermembrane recepter protein